MKKFNRVLAFIGIVLPIATWLWLWLQPDIVTRTGDAGVFISATASPGGLFAETLTSVQTSTTSVIVAGTYSGQRGQPMFIRDSTRSGLELCAKAHPVACAALAGNYPGPMQRVGPQRFHLSNYDRRAVLQITLALFGAGIVALLVNTVIENDELEAAARRQRRDKAD